MLEEISIKRELAKVPFGVLLTKEVLEETLGIFSEEACSHVLYQGSLQILQKYNKIFCTLISKHPFQISKALPKEL